MSWQGDTMTRPEEIMVEGEPNPTPYRVYKIGLDGETILQCEWATEAEAMAYKDKHKSHWRLTVVIGRTQIWPPSTDTNAR